MSIRNNYRWFLSVIACLFLAACFAPLDWEEGETAITLHFGSGSGSRSAGAFSGLVHEVTLTRGSTVMSETITGEESKTIPVTPGTWNIKVEGYNGRNKFARQKEEQGAVINVIAGQNNIFDIQMALMVNNSEDLKRIGTEADGLWNLGAHYIQTADISLNSSENWIPIGQNQDSTLKGSFTGSFNGNGYTISNLVINIDSVTSNQNTSFGLFSSIDGTVENINLNVNINIDVSGVHRVPDDRHLNVGGIAGESGGIVRSCVVTGEIKSSEGNIGGLLGWNSGNINNCYTNELAISVSGSGNRNNVGGISGGNNSASIIRNCYITGSTTINGGSARTGGIAGENGNGTIQYCVVLNSNINVTSSDYGRIASNGTTTNCYVRSTMTRNSSPWTTNKDGTDITQEQWNNQTWWRNTAQFSESVWAFKNNLPILKIISEGKQNPTVN